jgi:Ca2+-binding RTX toxin-like protein
MIRRLTRIALVAGLAAVGAIGIVGSASASYHQNLIREVHEGGATGDYVELQAYAAGENLVAGKYINTYDGGGGLSSSTLLPNNVANGANQATILIAHDASTPGADVINPGLNVINTGGTVCYSESPVGTAPALDCVAYTSGPTMFPTPPPSPYGTPVTLPGGDLTGSTLIRSIARGCPTSLDAADDTNDSAADFSVGAGTPRGNSVTPTETPCAPGTTTPVPCAGRASTIVGTNGNDTLTGTPAADVISGLGGKDKVKGLAGADVICGGGGRDTLVGGKGKDLLRGEGGRDQLRGGGGKDKLKGGPGKDVQIQ